MKRILFGGPEDGDPHRDLVARLEDKYHVMYTNDAVSMLWELDTARLTVDAHAKPYDLVLYDTRLFWGDATPKRRAELFGSRVVQYLSLSKKSVIIIADTDIAELIRHTSLTAGFVQFDGQYRVDAVLDTVHDLLHPNA